MSIYYLLYWKGLSTKLAIRFERIFTIKIFPREKNQERDPRTTISNAIHHVESLKSFGQKGGTSQPQKLTPSQKNEVRKTMENKSYQNC